MFPSMIHEEIVSSIMHDFSNATYRQEEQEPRFLNSWTVHATKSFWYDENDRRKGEFISDVAVTVDGMPVFLVEVAFTQKWDNVREKVGRLLKLESVLGVLVVNVDEQSKWASPVTEANASTDYIARRDWNTNAMATLAENPFGRIVVNGHTWVHDLSITLSFFDQTWAIGDEDPPKVSDFVIDTFR